MMGGGRDVSSRIRSNASPTVYPDILDATSSTGLERLRNGRPSARASCTKSMGAAGARGRAPVQGDVLAPPAAHAELQPVEPIQPTHPLAGYRPSFPAQ